MFWVEEDPECIMVARDAEEAERVYREHEGDQAAATVTVKEMGMGDQLSGWCRWDQERQSHVYVVPDPTVRQVLEGCAELGLTAWASASFISGDVDDAIMDDVEA